MSKKTFTPSPQQAAVIEWTKNGKGSAFIEAVAGAGKTTTLVALLANTEGSVAFTAYNKKIAREIEAKVAEAGISNNRIRVGTFHSFGLNAWRRVHPKVVVASKNEKAVKTCEEMTKAGVSEALHDFVLKLVSLAKQRALGVHGSIDDDSQWWNIIDHFDLAYEIENQEYLEKGVAAAKRALRYHINLAPTLIDFDDMIYMPVYSGCKMWENEWVLVDEAQDTNPARRALARKMLKSNGRAVFVGDRHQAIYGFTGADSDAIDQIIKDFNCTTLPLTATYRCPKTVVVEAQKYVAHIQAHETAPDGVVRTIAENDLTKQSLTPSDAILCRLTAPLVKKAFSLIRAGIACHVEGREIGAGLLKLVNRYKAKTLPVLRDKLEAYKDNESQKLIAKGKETQAEALIDRVDTALAIADQCKTVDELKNKILTMFQDADDNGTAKKTLTLSTVHKSKGREWPRVFILGGNKYMPSPWARKEWQQAQEANLIYVAYTRAQQELIHVPVAA
jgi:superfamily I DNA/RNA helicase